MREFTYQPNTDYKTTKGNTAPDEHLTSADFTSSEKAELKRAVENQFPGARVVRDATATYNCHAYAHARRHAWFNDITRFIEDDYYPFTPGTLRINDVVGRSRYAAGKQPTPASRLPQLAYLCFDRSKICRL